jgi:hypothetical protein
MFPECSLSASDHRQDGYSIQKKSVLNPEFPTSARENPKPSALAGCQALVRTEAPFTKLHTYILLVALLVEAETAAKRRVPSACLLQLPHRSHTSIGNHKHNQNTENDNITINNTRNDKHADAGQLNSFTHLRALLVLHDCALLVLPMNVL